AAGRNDIGPQARPAGRRAGVALGPHRHADAVAAAAFAPAGLDVVGLAAEERDVLGQQIVDARAALHLHEAADVLVGRAAVVDDLAQQFGPGRVGAVDRVGVHQQLGGVIHRHVELVEPGAGRNVVG